MSIREWELLHIPLGNLTILNKLYEAKRDCKRRILEFVSRRLVLKSPHKTMLVDSLNNLFRMNSSWFKN